VSKIRKDNHIMGNSTSRSQQLHDALGKIIAEKKSGERLLTEPELARQLGVSRATLREAMRTFETQGMLRRRQGSGTYVVHPPGVIESGLEVLESIEAIARQSGLPVTMGELNIKHRPADSEELTALELAEGAQVIQLKRTILAEDRQAAFLVDILPEGILDPEELEQTFTGSVLDLLLERGQPELDISRTDINAVTATAEIARAMGIQRGDVLLRFTALLYTTEGRPIDLSYSYFLPGYFRFHVVRRVSKV
jgi:GntR family transcriptional regulator